MTVAVFFHHPNLTLAVFDEVDRRVRTVVGEGQRVGLVHHSVYGTDGDLMTFEIWTSVEEFEAFGNILLPIVDELGLDSAQPVVLPLHRLFQKESSTAASGEENRND